MKIVTLPVHKGDLEIISAMTIDDLPAGFVLEPGPKHTFAVNKLPPGEYLIDLVISPEFSQLEPYLDVYCETNTVGIKLHPMIHFIRPDSPNQQHELYHCGNYYRHTRGCNLAGTAWQMDGGAQFDNRPVVTASFNQYKKNYPIIRAAILGEGATWEVKAD